MSDTTEENPPSPRHRLSTRIVLLSLLALVVTLSMTGWTLWLSWRLEGAGAAINDTGSLRMRANAIGVALLQNNSALIQTELDNQRQTLLRLQQGVPARPLFLPADPSIHQQFKQVTELWTDQLAPAAATPPGAIYLQKLPSFVAEADHLVSLIEHDNSSKTALLRFSQLVLIAIACAGTLTMIYLLFLWIIAPVQALQSGLQKLAQRELGARLPVETRDEFGVLTRGFNRMADELESLYRDLEGLVARKTAELGARNRELESLYEMAAFLNQPSDIDELCRGFLQRIMKQFGADGGSVRVIDPEGERLVLVVSYGLSPELEENEHCMKVDACLCGQATQQGVMIIRDFREIKETQNLHCRKDGFTSLAVFRILTQNEVLGSFSLHFREKHDVPSDEAQLLDILGQHLGVALDNRRLSAKARQLAVAQERNLLAQGLHDSIAQGLNFLNLQVQILDQRVQKGGLDGVRDIVPQLRAGIEESYQDVRELLSNFRSKLQQGELKAGIDETVARFQRQTGLAVALDLQLDEGAPLPPEQQLQVLFIVQEALSNVRKHAHASQVRISVHNRRDFEMEVCDDGVGYDPEDVSESAEPHVGLQIMQERARRISASLSVDTALGRGVCIRLLLPASVRQAA